MTTWEGNDGATWVALVPTTFDAVISPVATLADIGGGGGVLLLSGAVPMEGALDMGTNLINNVVNPVGAQDAATKASSEAFSNSLDHHTKYTDTEARAAVDNGTYLKLTGGTISGTLLITSTLTMGDNIILNNGAYIAAYDPDPQSGGAPEWYQIRNARFKDTPGPPPDTEGLNGDVCFMYTF